MYIKILKTKYLDAVVLLDVRVGESDGSSVMSDDVGDLVGSHGLLLDEA